MKNSLFIMICILIPSIVMGQNTSSKERPSWADGFFQEEANSYIEVVSATDYSEDKARNQAAQIIAVRRSLVTEQHTTVEVKNGVIQVVGHKDFILKARILDEYREYGNDGQWRVSLLVQTAKNPTFEFETVSVTNKYPVSARAFVPGMAQLHKGSKGKGVMFIVGEVAMVGGIVAFEGMRASAESKIKTTQNAADRQSYIDDASNMQNIRNGFIAGAVALYAWNVIDGIVSKGKKHVLVGTTSLRVSPYVSPYSSGVSLALRF